jgi:hypothetical protein
MLIAPIGKECDLLVSPFALKLHMLSKAEWLGWRMSSQRIAYSSHLVVP